MALTDWGGENLGPTALNTQFWEVFSLIGKNNIRTLQDRSVDFSNDETDGFGDAYIDANGRINSVVTASTSALFDTDKYKAIADSVYLVVEGTGLTAADYNINNCTAAGTATKLVVTCSDSGDEVKRAQLYKTLFFGTDGSDPALDSANFTTITALKTSVSRDVGKRGHYAQGVWNLNNGAQNGTYTGTFVNTTTNDDCSVWSSLTNSGASAYGCQFEFPSATIIHENNVASSTSDETGTDKSGDELSNPATVQLEGDWDNATLAATVKAIILCEGDVTWATGGVAGTVANTDFNSDNSVPDMTTASSSDLTYEIYHTIPTGSFGTAISSAFATIMVEDIEAGTLIDYKLINGSDDSGWLTINEITEFSTFSSGEPTTFIVRLTPKTTSPIDGYPSINGAWVRAS